jgi:hypothetical protein
VRLPFRHTGKAENTGVDAGVGSPISVATLFATVLPTKPEATPSPEQVGKDKSSSIRSHAYHKVLDGRKQPILQGKENGNHGGTTGGEGQSTKFKRQEFLPADKRELTRMGCRSSKFQVPSSKFKEFKVVNGNRR